MAAVTAGSNTAFPSFFSKKRFVRGIDKLKLKIKRRMGCDRFPVNSTDACVNMYGQSLRYHISHTGLERSQYSRPLLHDHEPEPFTAPSFPSHCSSIKGRITLLVAVLDHTTCCD
jgi:hypothetical protein